MPPRPHGSLRRRLPSYLLVLSLAALMLRLTSCVESRVLYFPSRDAFRTPAGYEDVGIETPDGLTLHGWFMPARGVPGEDRLPAVLHLHGNAGNVESHASWSESLPEHGISVLLLDYRGYGRSDPAGSLTRGKLLIDSNAALDHLLARPDVDPTRVGVLGVSLGGAFAMELGATRSEVKAVATVAAFRSFPAIAGAHLPLIGPLLMPGGMAPEANAARLGRRPLLVMHGTADEIVPPSHGDRIAAAAERAGVPVRLVRVDRAGHNDTGLDEPERALIAEFFRAALEGGGQE